MIDERKKKKKKRIAESNNSPRKIQKWINTYEIDAVTARHGDSFKENKIDL